MNNRLTLAARGSKIAGVCAGVADYYQLSRAGTRLATLLALLAFPMLTLAVYTAFALVLPTGRW